MQLYPTRSTFHVTVAGVGLITFGAAARLPPIVAFGGAMLLAIAFGLSLARMSTARLRAAGFEMVWVESHRVHRVPRGGSVVIRAELRNRSNSRARATRIRAIAASMLDASVMADVLDLPPHSRATFDVVVRGKRVGRWGVHGLALEVTGTQFGAEGLYEAPLLFANPLGIEVLPESLGTYVASARGGRAARAADTGRAGRSAGKGEELRELRDHAPGDPFSRIAWKASARRGRLVVREMDREERDIVWLVVDSSVELWAGSPGNAPLDRTIDEVGAAAVRHLRRGDSVGLIIGASRLRAWIEPDFGREHAARLAGALASAASVVDVDRSELDETAVARLVSEHARPLDAFALADVRGKDLDTLAARAERLRASAPFATRLPFAPTPREQTLRHYLASFGIESPPRIDGERPRTEETMGRVLERLSTERPLASIVHVWAPSPRSAAAMAKPIASLRRRGLDVRWSLPRLLGEIPVESGFRSFAPVIQQALRMRASAAHERGEHMLRRLGVHIVKVKRRATSPPAALREDGFIDDGP